MVLRIVLEGGLSDLQRLDLELDEPPADWTVQGERYEPLLDHWDRPMRDIAGRWRYRLISPYRAMPHGYEAPRVKP